MTARLNRIHGVSERNGRRSLMPLATTMICVAILGGPVRAAEPQDSSREAVAPFVQKYCVECHGPAKQEGKLRLDTLTSPDTKNQAALTTWQAVYEQLATSQMPPADAKQPSPDELRKLQEWLRGELTRAGVSLETSKNSRYPIKGNLVDHDSLFHRPSTAAPATPARLWRLSPFAYRQFADDLTDGRLIVQGGPSVRSKEIPLAATPFGLTSDPGFRDYAFLYQVSGSETQQLALNAKVILNGMLTKRPRYQPPRELTVIADADAPPSQDQIRTALRYLFRLLIYREPTDEEQTPSVAFATARIERLGNREGLIHGLVPVFLHPEAVFRSEFGAGEPDQHGRLLLGPIELAVAIAYALTDRRPDATLLAAARNGKLATRQDVDREVRRLLADATTDKPRILRFFHEYFEYDDAVEVFKDPADVKAAGIFGRYSPQSLVHDTDRLVLAVLKQDRDVLKQLLTTSQSFVAHDAVADWVKFASRRETEAKNRGVTPATHPFSTKPGKNQLHRHYNFAPEQWSTAMPFDLPADQRAGLLTQPSWLIAHSANTENHAIHRGKWVRERLLGGSIPDTPITVEAKLPDEPHATLRQRMRVTREAYCYKCHQRMDPLGLPFEMFDHLGQFRTTELDQPVDTSGEIVASGDPRLDGPVSNALEMIRKLAESERVQQVFVRHAFRYWMGRNETLDDAPTLQAAHRAYRESNGSMNALIVSLLTSDSFLYRRPR